MNAFEICLTCNAVFTINYEVKFNYFTFALILQSFRSIGNANAALFLLWGVNVGFGRVTFTRRYFAWSKNWNYEQGDCSLNWACEGCARNFKTSELSVGQCINIAVCRLANKCQYVKMSINMSIYQALPLFKMPNRSIQEIHWISFILVQTKHEITIYFLTV